MSNQFSGQRWRMDARVCVYSNAPSLKGRGELSFLSKGAFPTVALNTLILPRFTRISWKLSAIRERIDRVGEGEGVNCLRIYRISLDFDREEIKIVKVNGDCRE